MSMLRLHANISTTRDRRQQQQGDSNTHADDRDKKTRTRSGCLNCRRRRRKCDETRPTCLNCLKRNEDCERGVRLSFRAENAHTLSEHEIVNRPRKRPKRYEIRDVTSDVVDQYRSFSPTLELQSPSTSSTDTYGQRQVETVHHGLGAFERRLPADSRTFPQLEISASRVPAVSSDPILLSSNDATDRGNGTRRQHESGYSTVPARSLEPATSNLPSTEVSEIHPTPNPQAESAAENLLFLRNVHSHGDSATPMPSTLREDDIVVSPTFSSPINQITPDSLLDDGVFLPGSTYRELHTTLRQHLIDETNPALQYRVYSPNRALSEVNWLEPRRSPSINIDDASDDNASYSGQTPPMELSPAEECRLWKNWIDEIACWLDKFDNYRHFQHTLPVMAKTCDHLRFSMLAVSARQIELKNASKPTDQSLALYQQAIHLLVPQLHTRTIAVIASCVVLCVLEMLSCSPKAWRRHLDGCANLLQAVGITGFSGGVEQALFWCFARMDVCGGLIDSMKTLIPAGQWASKIDLDTDISKFRTQTAFDGYANYAVYLCAQVVELLSYGRDRRSKNDEKSYIYRWSKLWRYVQDWERRRPDEMHPVSIIAKSTPFPTVLYSNPAATSGNQLFHTASILMLQNKPAALKLDYKPQPIQWHARQICGISLSNDHHGAWTNSIQPLWIAGRCMSKAEEHAAILDHLLKIETESGWGTKWRMEDLREYWEIEYG